MGESNKPREQRKERERERERELLPEVPTIGTCLFVWERSFG